MRSDDGLQPERTRLAWRPTALAATPVAMYAAHVLVPHMLPRMFAAEVGPEDRVVDRFAVLLVDEQHGSDFHQEPARGGGR